MPQPSSYVKIRPEALDFYPKPEIFHALGVENRVFQQIHQHLRDQHGVHGNADEFFRNFHMNLRVRVVLVEFHQHRVDQLLQNGVVLGKTDSGGVNAGHGQ